MPHMAAGETSKVLELQESGASSVVISSTPQTCKDNMEHPPALAWADGSQDLTLQFKVHLGVWTDWSRGRVLGSTLTLTRTQANLLIAFTASFVVFVGSRFWRIACLVLHQSYSSAHPSDALHHQRQALLRNSGSSDSGILAFLALLSAWRTSSVKAIRRTALGLVLAVLCTVAFTLAGGFSSQIQLGSDNHGGSVLLKGDHCAVLPEVTSLQEQVAWQKTVAKFFYTASNYVQQCYSENSTGLTDCNYFVKQRLPGYINTAAPCPFNNTICRNNSSNIELDTGFIDSHTHLGINAPPKERIFFRRKLQCAPLVTEGRNFPNGNFTRYNYGHQWVSNSQLGPDRPYWNYTYEVENVDKQYERSTDRQLIEQQYNIRSFFAGTQNATLGTDPASSFLPNDELARTDADIFVVFLSGHGVFFTEPLHDEWYRATEPFGILGFGAQNSSMYRPAESASPLGCATQWQFCHGDTSNCGPLGSYYDAKYGALEALASDAEAVDRLQWLTWSLYIDGSGEAALLQQLQGDALLSKLSLIVGYQGRLPENEWQLDVGNWFAVYLNMMQSNILETVSGFMVADTGIGSDEPDTDAARRMCVNQKIRTTRYSSFSFFGIMFTYILGVLVLAASYSLEPILACLHRNRKYKQYAYLEWTANETLQLQRLAHEEANGASGEWSRCTNWVPTTKPGICLSSLDISDLGHPRLQQTPDEKASSGLTALHSVVSPNGTLVPQASDPALSAYSRQKTLTFNSITSLDVGNAPVRLTQPPKLDSSPGSPGQNTQPWLPSPLTEPSSPQDQSQSQHTHRHGLDTTPGGYSEGKTSSSLADTSAASSVHR
ncbi:hypothetical protein DHEL01_v202921 [Diaporthe helianthi]|uniref:Uncharacterized protein n=1 Tax=Diaporthe helianthi TaxID=158607 RepID=A0A2P5I853_DIAHE|nr:hypothetical protein DHEL01_v202921 [Diaporthe helianthi]